MNTENKNNVIFQDDMVQEFLNKWKDSEEILIGIGHELELKEEEIWKGCRMYQKYQEALKSLSDETQMWVKNAILLHEIENHNEKIEKQIGFYNLLHDKLKGRPYFVVSTCKDGLINYSDMDPSKIVTPCGDFMHGQCQDKCNPAIYDTREALKKIYQILETMEDDKQGWKEIEETILVCPSCNKTITFNQYKQKGYNENAYKRQWGEYLKWIQRTLNHKLLLVELGEGFETPTVIRWPFEKVTFLNQKAFLYRINKRFYQLTEDLAQRGKSIQCDSAVFLEQLKLQDNF